MKDSAVPLRTVPTSIIDIRGNPITNPDGNIIKPIGPTLFEVIGIAQKFGGLNFHSLRFSIRPDPLSESEDVLRFISCSYGGILSEDELDFEICLGDVVFNSEVFGSFLQRIRRIYKGASAQELRFVRYGSLRRLVLNTSI